MLHRIGEKQERDTLIYEEKHGAYYLDLSQTKDKKYTIISSQARSSSEMLVIDRANNNIISVVQKEKDVRYFVEHNRVKLI